MKRIISVMLSMMMILSCVTAMNVMAFDGNITIGADKTAQWTAQEKSAGYDLRIHGYKNWETAAYIGFTLPDNFTPENLVSAKLSLDTVSYNKTGTAYLYAADYSKFDNNAQYEGASDKPAYDESEIVKFTSADKTGKFEIDISDYMKSLENNTANAAFRIDVKSQNTNNKWVIGSCNNSATAPQLILEYDDPDITKTEVTVNIKNGNDILANYSDRVVGEQNYILKNEQIRYIRRSDNIYCLPMNGQTEYQIDDESAEVNVQFEKLTVPGLVFFEDFNISSMTDISQRGISATNAEIANGTLSVGDGGEVNLPAAPANTGTVTAAFAFKANSGGTFTFRNGSNDITSLTYSSDTDIHTASLTLDGENASVSVDGSPYLSVTSAVKSITSIAVNGGAAIDNIRISAADLTYTGIIKNNNFVGGTDNWTISDADNVYAADDMSGTFVELKNESSISQQITGIASGKYDIHARVKNDNMGNIAYVYAKAEGHPIMKTSASVTTYINNGDWRDIYIRGVNIDEGECEIGVVLNQLGEDEIMIDPRVTDEPMPDGKGVIRIDSIELISAESNDVFLTGGDINWLTFLEDKGVKYYDVDGREKDAIQIMAENGANIVRLRLYNDPGKGHGDGSDYLPDGYQNPDDILALAKRAKDKGMQIQLTFHYSDYWTNAETQLIPHEWQEEIDKLGEDAAQDEKDEKIEQLLYDFTKDFMQKMHNQGTDPEYVSFGNEMHTGLLFAKNKSAYDYGSTLRWDRLSSLLKTASKAVKEVSPDTKVILHLDGAGNWSKYNTFFTKCKDNEVPYDVIGISYYPYWYPDYDVTSLVSFCNRLIDTFDKDIMFMETGYSFADKNTIGGQDTRFTNVGPYQETFGQSNMGQKAFMEELYSGFKQIKNGRCLGDLYWDPIMIQHDGVGWAYRESNDTIRENKNIAITVFDTQGRKLPSQSTFKDNGYITDTVAISGHISELGEQKSVTFTVNNKDYTVNPDRFGDYVLRVPYADQLTVSVIGSVEESCIIDMLSENVKGSVDFTLNDEPSEITAITAGVNDEGILSYSVSYRTDAENVTLYIALYDENGKMAACKKNEKQGSFDNCTEESYTVKAFLWQENMHPVCGAKEKTVIK